MVTGASISGSHVHSLPAFPGLNLLWKPVSRAEDGKVRVPWRHSCEKPSSALSTTAESWWQDGLAGEHEKWASQSLPHHTIQAKPCAANGLLPVSEASNLHALLPLWRQKSTSLPIYNNPSGFSRPHRQGHFFFTIFHLLSRNELLFTVTHSQSVLVHPAGFCFHQIYALETLTG